MVNRLEPDGVLVRDFRGGEQADHVLADGGDMRRSGGGQGGPVTRAAGRMSGLAGRLVRLYAGLVGYGLSLALMVRARLGLGPWDVLHQGIARHLGVQLGWVTIGVSAIVLLTWIPLRQRPGLGTISNAVVVGLVVNAGLDVLPAPAALAWRITWLVAAIALNALATGCYIGAGLGPGPRDGLMTGIAARGHSLRVVRTAIELSVLALGWVLGGAIGVGTVAYAVAIGPLTHILLPRLTVTQRAAGRPALPGLSSAATREASASRAPACLRAAERPGGTPGAD